MTFEEAKLALSLRDITLERAEYSLIKVTWNKEASFIEESFLEQLAKIVDFVHENSWHEGFSYGLHKDY